MIVYNNSKGHVRVHYLIHHLIYVETDKNKVKYFVREGKKKRHIKRSFKKTNNS